jgi:hypothetical protein
MRTVDREHDLLTEVEVHAASLNSFSLPFVAAFAVTEKTGWMAELQRPEPLRNPTNNVMITSTKTRR